MTDAIALENVLQKGFDKTDIAIHQNVVSGQAWIGTQRYHLVGTIENTSFGVDEAFEMADQILKVVKSPSTAPIVLLTDVTGQKLSMRDEWLGMYAYFAHVLQCLHLAREKGHVLVTVIYNQAIGGSFIAFGMMADRIYALSHTELAVMWLEGMAKVTKIDIEVLKEISKTSPVFAPGVENFKKLGGLHEVVTLDALKKQLVDVLGESDLAQDMRAYLGKQYGGRTAAYDIIEQIKAL